MHCIWLNAPHLGAARQPPDTHAVVPAILLDLGMHRAVTMAFHAIAAICAGLRELQLVRQHIDGQQQRTCNAAEG